MKSVNSRWIIRIAIVLAVILLIITAFLMLRVKTVEITGTDRYTSEEISDYIFQGNNSRNTLLCYFEDKFKKHVTIPFVEDYRIEFKSLFAIEVIVYEKSIVGYVSYMGSYMYFDKDGIVVESTSRALEDIPKITGLKFGHIALYQPLPVSDTYIFEEILNLTQVLSVYNLNVDRIQYSRLGEASLFIDNVEVILGDNTALNGKISELSDIMPEIEGLSGTLYLDTFDESKEGQMFTFREK